MNDDALMEQSDTSVADVSEPPSASARISGTVAETAESHAEPICRPDVFEAISAGGRALRRLFQVASREHLGEGHALVEAATKPDFAYRLRRGWACRLRHFPNGRRSITDIYLPGDFIGLDTILNHHAPDSVVMLTKGAAFELEIPTLLAAAARPEIALALMWEASEVQRRIERFAAAMRRLDAAERVALALTEFHDRLWRRGLQSGMSYNLPLTQRQLGDYLGMTAIHVNRVLKMLRDERIVTVDRHVVIIADHARLSTLAEARMSVPHLPA
jgi:CRP-like cAMP-binding protein